MRGTAPLGLSIFFIFFLLTDHKQQMMTLLLSVFALVTTLSAAYDQLALYTPNADISNYASFDIYSLAAINTAMRAEDYVTASDAVSSRENCNISVS